MQIKTFFPQESSVKSIGIKDTLQNKMLHDKMWLSSHKNAIPYIKREILINKDLLIYRQAKIKDEIERLSVVVMTPLSSLEKA